MTKITTVKRYVYRVEYSRPGPARFEEYETKREAQAAAHYLRKTHGWNVVVVRREK